MRTVIERLDEFLIDKGDNDNQFRVKTGLSTGFMDKARKNNTDSFQKNTIDKIKKAYPALNISWLLTGDGQREIGSILLSSEISSVPNNNNTLPIPKNEYIDLVHSKEILSIKLDSANQKIDALSQVVDSKQKEIETLKILIENLK